MSLYDYRMSQDIAKQGYPFYALIMAAMRQGDNENVEKLKDAWPLLWDEMFKRYSAPGGLLVGEEE